MNCAGNELNRALGRCQRLAKLVPTIHVREVTGWVFSRDLERVHSLQVPFCIVYDTM